MNEPKFSYIKFSIDYPYEAVQCKMFISESVKVLFGEVGASKPYDLVQYSTKEKGGVLRIPSRYLVEVRAAMMLDSRFRIHKVSSSALALLANSRSYEHTKQHIQQTRKRKRSAS